MSQRKYNFVPGEFYHLYNRGVEKRVIFQDEDDYRRFQSLLFIANTSERVNVRDVLRDLDSVYEYKTADKLVAIGAYCLMPNHFHLLATPVSGGGISLFMQKLSSAYSMYFNKKYERTGALFEGKFKSQLATEDRYLKYLFSYIHLNPVKLIQSDWKQVGIKDATAAGEYVKEYHYSSCVEMMGRYRKESLILNSNVFPKYFENVSEAEREVHEWLNFSA